jgi:hypothetical protein
MKYKPSLLGIGELSGSGGSVTASRNRFGPYFRNRVIPVNPNTPGQTSRRVAFSNASSLWKTLSAAQKLSWEEFGAQYVRTDSLGGTYTLNGFMAFMETNIYRQLFGVAIALDPTGFEALATLTSQALTATITGPVLSLAFTPTPIGATNRLIVSGTGGKSPGISFFGASQYRLLAASGLNVASPLDLMAAWITDHGTMILNTAISVRAAIVNAAFMRGPYRVSNVIVNP